MRTSGTTAQGLLTGLADDFRRLFAAGTGAGDDHRLSKHAGAVRLLGGRVPALAPLADAIDRARAAVGTGERRPCSIREAVPALTELVSDPDEAVRQAARAAITATRGE